MELRDKTKDYELVYNPNYNKQNYPFFRLELFIDKIKKNNGFHQIILKIRKFIMFKELCILVLYNSV